MLGIRIVLSTVMAALVSLAAPTAADAFCGFYVAGADDALYNNATQVEKIMQKCISKRVCARLCAR